MKPINKKQAELLDRAESLGIETNINTRWEMGIEHNGKAEELAGIIGDLDWLFTGDYFCFKFGGDGDNGETLTYLLDIYFDMIDAENL